MSSAQSSFQRQPVSVAFFNVPTGLTGMWLFDIIHIPPRVYERKDGYGEITEQLC